MTLSLPSLWITGSVTPYWSILLRRTASRRSTLSSVSGFSAFPL